MARYQGKMGPEITASTWYVLWKLPSENSLPQSNFYILCIPRGCKELLLANREMPWRTGNHKEGNTVSYWWGWGETRSTPCLGNSMTQEQNNYLSFIRSFIIFPILYFKRRVLKYLCRVTQACLCDKFQLPLRVLTAHGNSFHISSVTSSSWGN